MSVTTGASAAAASRSNCSRSPRLLPNATATGITGASIQSLAANHQSRIENQSQIKNQKSQLFHPASRQHFTDASRTFRPLAEHVLEARGSLFEEALVLERLAEDHVHHVAVPGVGHLRDTRTPALHEAA